MIVGEQDTLGGNESEVEADADLELARRSGMALWRQIAARLEKDVIGGGVEPGDRLPTEHQLAERFAVNRHTVRRAIAELAEKGLVRIEQGRGTFVQEAVIDYRLRRRTRFSENLADLKKRPSGRLIRLVRLAAEGSVARALALRQGSPVLMIERLGEADGRPLSVSAHYFPLDRFPRLEEAYGRLGSITRALAECGLADYTRRSTRITARPARLADARLLQQPPGRPVLMTEAINVDAHGQPIEYSVGRWASDRVQLVVEGE